MGTINNTFQHVSFNHHCQGGIIMKIDSITGADVIPRGSLDNSIKYTKSVTTDKPEPDVIEKIREDNKGVKIDTTA